MAWLKSVSYVRASTHLNILSPVNILHFSYSLNRLGFVPSSFLQALRLFRLASELESRAAALRLKALQHMTISMAGVDCRELFTLIILFFGW